MDDLMPNSALISRSDHQQISTALPITRALQINQQGTLTSFNWLNRLPGNPRKAKWILEVISEIYGTVLSSTTKPSKETMQRESI